MSQSIFDWDEEESEAKDEEPEQPAALIPYQPDPFRPPDPPPVEYQPDSFQSAPVQPQPQEQAPFEYHSDPFQPHSGPGSEEPDPFGVQPEHIDDQHDPFWNEPDPFAPSSFETPPVEQQLTSSPEETSRRSGLAFSAGIVFFSSVVFMLFLGWIADWLVGSSPWGLVGGIILGSVIGLIQFVRITSQIFNTKKSEAAMRPLMPPDDEH